MALYDPNRKFGNIDQSGGSGFGGKMQGITDIASPFLNAMIPGAGSILSGVSKLFGGGKSKPQQYQQQQLGPFNNSFNPTATATASATANSKSVLNNLNLPDIPGMPALQYSQMPGMPGITPPGMQQPMQMSGMSNALPMLQAMGAGGGMSGMAAPSSGATPSSPMQIQGGYGAPLEGGMPDMPGFAMSPRGGMSGGMPPLQAQAQQMPPNATAMALQPRTPQYDTTGAQAPAQPLQAGDTANIAPDQPLPATVDSAMRQLDSMAGRGDATARQARDAFGERKLDIEKSHEANKAGITPLYKAAIAKVDALTELNRTLSTPEGINQHRLKLEEQIMSTMPPSYQAAIQRYNNALSGASGTAGGAHPNWSMAGKVLKNVAHNIGVGGLQAYGVPAQYYDYLKAHSAQATQQAQFKADEHVFDHFQARVTSALGDTLSSVGRELDGAKALMHDLEQQSNHADTQYQDELTKAFHEITGLAGLDMRAAGDEAGIQEHLASGYSQGVHAAAVPEQLRQGRERIGIARQNAEKGANAFNLASEKWQGEKQKQGLEIQNLKDRNKKLEQGFPPTVPNKAKDGDMEAYRRLLWDGVQSKQWSEGDAKKAYFWEKAREAE